MGGYDSWKKDEKNYKTIDLAYGNYGTGYIGLYLSDSAYDAILDDENFTHVREHLVKTDENVDIAAVKKSFGRLFKDNEIPVLVLMDSVTSKSGRTMVSSTIVLFLAAFAFIVLIVSIFLNRFPLDESRGSVGLNLVLKQTCGSVGRTILLFAVTFVLMTLLSFTSVLLFNVNVRPENFLTTLSEELPDIRVMAESGKTNELLSVLEKENVKAVKYGISTMEYEDGNIPVIICEDHSLLENDILYEGSHPKNSDEIAIGSVFRSNNNIGDKFTLSQDGKENEFTVTGFIQSVNNNGLIAEITDEPLETFNLYL